jgi:hypothetical protein
MFRRRPAAPFVDRDVAMNTIWMIADILEELRKIRRLLEADDGEEENPETQP